MASTIHLQFECCTSLCMCCHYARISIYRYLGLLYFWLDRPRGSQVNQRNNMCILDNCFLHDIKPPTCFAGALFPCDMWLFSPMPTSRTLPWEGVVLYWLLLNVKTAVKMLQYP